MISNEALFIKSIFFRHIVTKIIAEFVINVENKQYVDTTKRIQFQKDNSMWSEQ